MDKQVDKQTRLVFNEVKDQELEVIQKRRAARKQPCRSKQHCERNLFGLALSGGGIRSATFNLGILQILARYRLLRMVDYMSLNSGGGYIGGWLAAWIRRDGLEHVEHRLGYRGSLKPAPDKEEDSTHVEEASEEEDEWPDWVAKIAKQAKRPFEARPKEPERPSVDQTIEPEPYPISHLRQYTNYLTPKVGLFSVDTWVLVATYLRNLLLNLAVIGLASTALIFLVRAIVEFLAPVNSQENTALLLKVSALILLFIAVATFGYVTRPALVEPAPMPTSRSAGDRDKKSLFSFFFDLPQVFIVIPTFFASTLIARLGLENVEAILREHSIAFSLHASQATAWFTDTPDMLRQVAVLKGLEVEQIVTANTSALPVYTENPHWAILVYFFFIWLILSVLVFWRHLRKPSAETRSGRAVRRALTVLLLLIITVVTAIVSTAATHYTLLLLQEMEVVQQGSLRFVLGAPLVTCAILVVNISFIGLAGRLLTEQQRQWWSRLSAWLIIYSLVWIVLISIVDLVPKLIDLSMSGALPLAPIPIVVWLVLSAAGAYSGHRLEAYQEAAGIARRIFMQAAPLIFIVGLLILNTMLTRSIGGLHTLEVVKFINAEEWVQAHVGQSYLITCVVLGVMTAALSSRIDVNQFSMHNFYKARLVRAFLAASHPDREADKFTSFSRADDVPLVDLAFQSEPNDKSKYDGPIPIYNCSLNLVASTRLSLQERKADSFTFTPYHFGYHYRPPEPSYKGIEEFDKHLFVNVSDPSYRHTPAYGSQITTGLAMAVSGAAISPNMGFRSSSTLAFLLTVFNVRLGAWVLNTRQERLPSSLSPRFGLASLFGELFARTNENTDYVYLSDGGHFENLAVYELIRRRCRYIIATDAAADPKYAFLDLGNLIRKCRSDFGINIEIDLSEIRPDESGVSRRQFAVGRIRYDQSSSGEQPGFLLYIKSSITGDETVDLQAYRREHPSFPHQSTADQWFTESQFDSYRALGYQIGDTVFGSCGKKDASKMLLETFFSHLRRAAYPTSDRVRKHFTDHASKLQDLLADLSNEPKLEFLDSQLFPDSHRIGRAEQEAGSAIPDDADKFRRGFYFCNRLLQLMENVFIDLRLDREFDHPDNRGWLNLFHYWAGSEMLRLTWALSASTYGVRFQKFCSDRLDLEMGTVVAESTDISGLSIDSIADLGVVGDVFTRKERTRLTELLGKRAGLDYVDAELDKLWIFKIDIPAGRVVGQEGTAEPRLPCGFAITDNRNRVVFIRLRDHLRGLGLARLALDAMREFECMPGEMAPEARELYEKIARDPERGRYFELLLYSMVSESQSEEADTP